jgi:hypothetical protein
MWCDQYSDVLDGHAIHARESSSSEQSIALNLLPSCVEIPIIKPMLVAWFTPPLEPQSLGGNTNGVVS